MKKCTCMLLGLFLINSLFFASGALAGCCGSAGGMGGGGWSGCGRSSFVSSAVENLTPEQSDKLATLQKNHIQETATLRNDLAVKRIERDQLLAQPQPNRDEILSKQREITDLQAQLQQKALTRELALRSILTAEQLNQLNAGYGFNVNLLPGQGFGPCRGRGCMKPGGRCGSCW